MHANRFALLAALFAAPAVAQLTPPPGPVTETDRVREEADARTPISAGFTTITEPGSYYLTNNISSLVVAAIVVDSPDVTIDLNGYTINGGIGGINVNADRVTIRNGRIVGVQGTAVAGRSAEQLVIEDLVIENCGRGTILVPRNETAIELRNGRVERTRIIDCPGGIGFFSDHAMIKDCFIEKIDGAGIRFRGAANFSVYVEGCTLRDIGTIGIEATDHARIRNTTIEGTGTTGIGVQRDALIENVTVIEAATVGITAGANARVLASSAIGAGTVGISVGDGGVIRDCTVAGAGEIGYGVGDGGLIQDSTMRGSTRFGGISTDFGIQLAQGATARGNTLYEYQAAGITMESDAVADSNTIFGNENSATDNGFLATGAFVQVTRNNVSFSGSQTAVLGSTASWLTTSVANFATNSRIGPANDLDSPWSNFVD